MTATKTTKGKSRLRNAAINGALCIGVFALLFGLLEIYIRTTQPVAVAYNYSVCCDYVMKPDQKFSFNKTEFETRVTVNALGLRGDLPDLTRPVRILVLGDSFAFGYGVEDDESFPALLAKQFPADTAARMTVINTGHSGYDTKREAAFFETYGDRLNPTVVVVAFVLNDVVSNSGRFTFNAVPDGWLRYFPLRGTANLISYLIRNPEELLFKIGLNEDFKYETALSCLKLASCEDDWRETAVYLEAIAARAERFSAPVVFLHVPVQEEIERQGPGAGVVEERLRSLAEAVGATFVPLRGLLDPEHYYRIDGHWTPAGHAIVAKRLAAALREEGLVDRQPM